MAAAAEAEEHLANLQQLEAITDQMTLPLSVAISEFISAEYHPSSDTECKIEVRMLRRPTDPAGTQPALPAGVQPSCIEEISVCLFAQGERPRLHEATKMHICNYAYVHNKR
jgi:hypothetical protein